VGGCGGVRPYDGTWNGRLIKGEGLLIVWILDKIEITIRRTKVTCERVGLRIDDQLTTMLDSNTRNLEQWKEWLRSRTCRFRKPWRAVYADYRRGHLIYFLFIP